MSIATCPAVYVLDLLTCLPLDGASNAAILEAVELLAGNGRLPHRFVDMARADLSSSPAMASIFGEAAADGKR